MKALASFCRSYFVALLLVLTLGLLSCVRADSQAQPPPGGQGPYFHQIYSASSADGLIWTHDNRLLLDHASVPAAIVTPEGTIRIYYVDATQQPETTNCAESSDGGLTFKVLGCAIANRTADKALDPSIVRLSDGRYRLYYFGSAHPGQPPGTLHTIYSAISNDGVHFTEEGAVFSYPGLVDPDVFWTGKEWLMFVFAGRGTIVARSRDGLSFEYVGPLNLQNWGTTAPVKLNDGRFRLYAFDQPAAQKVASFISSDGLNWTQEPGVRLTAPTGYQLTDPFVIQLPDGSWKMIYKVSRAGAAQQPSPPGNQIQITGAYLMAFHACDNAAANCRDPRNHKVYLAQSDDGIRWSIVPNWTPFRGSVPDVIRRGNTLYIYSTGGGLVRYRLDANTLEPSVNVSVTGLQEGFVDPSLILDDQGRLVLFFLHGQIGSDPAGCPSGQPTCVKRFGSATEVPGSDGTRFVLDEGDRATVTLNTSGPVRSASDPDIFFDGTQYVLYLSHGPSISVWTSRELRGSYQKVADLATGTGGVPSGYFDTASKQYWTYSHVQQGGVAVIRRAVHKDFSRSLNESDWATVLTGSSMGLSSTTHVESPGFAVNTTVGLANGGQSAGFTITIGTPTGKTLKPLLGVNVGPIPAGNDPRNADLTAAYQQIGVTMIRTHDYYGPLDMATMYPNQNADPSNPASYDFTASDKIFSAILAGGFEPYLRLGDSWNNAPGYPPANPRRPINPNNWVRAAVEVVRHYKELSQRKGIPMRYVEIWNEPDNRRFWDGTPVEFFQLFAQTAKALKTAFPDLKIGGPGLTPAGFKAPQGQQYTRSFLEYMQRNNVSFDFFSWHIYSNDPTDFTGAALFYRELLNQYGYTKAESHITEWNTEFREGQGGDPALRTGAKGAALMTAAWIGLQQQGVDVSTFYRGTDPSLALPTFYGIFYADGRPKPVALAFSLWSQMAAHSQQLNLATSPSTSGLWMLAGQNSEGEIALLMANPNAAPTSWSLAFSDGRNISDYKLIVKTISDASAEIETSTPEGNVIAIGAYTVQLVIIKR